MTLTPMRNILIFSLLFNLGLFLHFIYEIDTFTLRIVGQFDNTFIFTLSFLLFSLFCQFLFIFNLIKSIILKFFIKITSFFINIIGLGGGLFALYKIRLNSLCYKDVVFETPFFSLVRNYSRDDYMKAIKYFYEKNEGMHLYNILYKGDFDILCKSNSMAELEWKIKYHIEHPLIPFTTKVYDFIWNLIKPTVDFIKNNPDQVFENIWDLTIIAVPFALMYFTTVHLWPKIFFFYRAQQRLRFYEAFFADFDAQHPADPIQEDVALQAHPAENDVNALNNRDLVQAGAEPINNNNNAMQPPVARDHRVGPNPNDFFDDVFCGVGLNIQDVFDIQDLEERQFLFDIYKQIVDQLEADEEKLKAEEDSINTTEDGFFILMSEEEMHERIEDSMRIQAILNCLDDEDIIEFIEGRLGPEGIRELQADEDYVNEDFFKIIEVDPFLARAIFERYSFLKSIKI